jgi:transposase
MKDYIASDAHKKYSIFGSIDERGRYGEQHRVGHNREEYRAFLGALPKRSTIAIESIGNWYWMIEEMEKAGHEPVLVHPRKAKLMMGLTHKTDRLDVNGLAMLSRNGTIPKIWIPSGELRDKRELPRVRMAMVGMRTKLKNRIHATLSKYNIVIEEVSDIFGVSGRKIVERHLGELPLETRRTVGEELKLLDEVEGHIKEVEKRIREIVSETREMQLLKTIPGVGDILSVVIALEIGEIDRFSRAEQLASYSGTVPRIRSSGGRAYFGKVLPEVNRYLKWAFIETANMIVLHQERMPYSHAVQLYTRIRHKKGHAKAVVALARHLAEATFWVLKKGEAYREPLRRQVVSSTQG